MNNLKLSLKGRYSRSDEVSRDVYAYAYTPVSPNGDVSIYSSLRDIDHEAYTGELFLSKAVEAFGREHDVLVGVDHRDQERNFLLGYTDLGQDNLFDPRNDLDAPSNEALLALG